MYASANGRTHCSAHISFRSPSKCALSKHNNEHKNVTTVPLDSVETRARARAGQGRAALE